MIHAVLDAKVLIDTCYIDTVGTPGNDFHFLPFKVWVHVHTNDFLFSLTTIASYQAKLEREFAGMNITFVVEKKADASYAPCSAASVGK